MEKIIIETQLITNVIKSNVGSMTVLSLCHDNMEIARIIVSERHIEIIKGNSAPTDKRMLEI